MATTLGQLFVDLLLNDSTFGPGLAKAATNVESFGKVATSLADKLEGALTTAFEGVTVAIAGVTAASALIGVAFEKQIGKVAILAGANVDELAASAREMGASTAFSASDAAEAMESLAQAGFHTTEIIAGTRAALSLAAASGGQLSDATGILASTMSQFGLKAADATNISDIFTKALNSSQLDMEGLTAAMGYAGPVGAAFGQTLAETTAGVALFSNLGLEGSKAGTAFRMSLSQAANVSVQAELALKKYGLTAKDINPELHNLGDILTTVGKAGVTATDSLVIFGTEAGGSINTLAKQAVDTKTATDTTFAGILDGLRKSSGSAEATAAQMMDNTAGRFEQASGAFEELLLTIFDLYKSNIGPVIEQVGLLFNDIADEFKMRSGEIRGDVGGALQEVAMWIGENRKQWAVMAVDSATAIGEMAQALATLLPYLNDILPYLKQIGIAVATVFLAAKVYTLVSGIGALYTSVVGLTASLVGLGASAATTFTTVWTAGATAAAAATDMLSFGVDGLFAAMSAFYTAATTATGGTLALVAAIGVLVVGLGTLIYSLYGARDATDDLRKAKEHLAEMDAATDAAGVKAAGDTLEQTRSAIAQKISVAEASGETTKALEAELDALSGLTAETAAAKYQSGELVKTAEGFRTVAGALADGGDAAAAVTARLEETKAGIASTGKEIASLQANIANAEANNLDVVQRGVGGITTTLGDARARLARLQDIQQKDNGTVATIEHELTKSTLAEIDERTAARGRDARSAVDFSKTAAAQQVTDAKTAADKIQSERERLAKETAALYTKTLEDDQDARASDIGKQNVQRLRELDDIRKKFGEEEALYKGDAAKIAEIEAQKDETIRLANDKFAAQDEAAAKARAAKVADVLLTAEQGIAADAAAVQSESITAAETLRRDYAAKMAKIDTDLGDALTAIAGLSAQEQADATAKFQADSQDARLALQADFNKKMAAAREADIKTAIDAPSKLRVAWQAEMAKIAGLIDVDTRVSLGKALKGVEDFAKGAGTALTALQGVASGVFDKVSGLVSQLTGVDFTSIASDLMSAEGTFAADQPKAAGFSGAGASQQSDPAAAFATDFVAGIVAQATQFSTMLVSVLPPAIDALVKAMPQVMKAAADAIPLVVNALVDGIPRIVRAFLKELPTILDAILKAIPKLIKALSKALVEVIDALPSLVDKILKAIPGIITAIIAAIPRIIRALVRSIPDIIGSIIDAIPLIIAAVVTNIPKIINSLIRQLPQLVIKLVFILIEKLPMIIPKLVVEIIKSLPQIVWGLIKAIVGSIGAVIKAFIDGIANFFKNFLNKLNPFKKNAPGNTGHTSAAQRQAEAQAQANASAYSGIEYVPATMRATVHQGEAIIPADRNAQRLRGTTAPAPGGAAQNYGGGAVQGGAPIEISVTAEGRLLEAVQVRANSLGRATKVARAMRRAGGVKVGLDRGKFSPWSY